MDEVITELLLGIGLLHGYPDDPDERTDEEAAAAGCRAVIASEINAAGFADEDALRTAFAADIDRYRGMVIAAVGEM